MGALVAQQPSHKLVASGVGLALGANRCDRIRVVARPVCGYIEPMLLHTDLEAGSSTRH